MTLIGFRKIILGIVFLSYATFLSYVAIKQGTDLLAVSGVISSMALGVGVVVWGNVQASKNGGSNGS